VRVHRGSRHRVSAQAARGAIRATRAAASSLFSPSEAREWSRSRATVALMKGARGR
jgi:hypothetical protein